MTSRFVKKLTKQWEETNAVFKLQRKSSTCDYRPKQREANFSDQPVKPMELEEEVLQLREQLAKSHQENVKLREDNKKLQASLLQLAETISCDHLYNNQMSPICSQETDSEWSSGKVDSFLLDFQAPSGTGQRSSRFDSRYSLRERWSIQPAQSSRILELQAQNQTLKSDMCQLKTYIEKQFSKIRQMECMVNEPWSQNDEIEYPD